MTDFVSKMLLIINRVFNTWLPSLFNFIVGSPLLCFILALMLFSNVVAFLQRVRNKTTL